MKFINRMFLLLRRNDLFSRLFCIAAEHTEHEKIEELVHLKKGWQQAEWLTNHRGVGCFRAEPQMQQGGEGRRANTASSG